MEEAGPNRRNGWAEEDYDWEPRQLTAAAKPGRSKDGSDDGEMGEADHHDPTSAQGAARGEQHAAGSPEHGRTEDHAVGVARGVAGEHLCLVRGCAADLTQSKAYYRRFRICEAHMKSLSLSIEGRSCRFCQQCGKFHPVEEFDGANRNCRKALMNRFYKRRNLPLVEVPGGRVDIRRDPDYRPAATVSGGKRGPESNEPRRRGRPRAPRPDITEDANYVPQPYAVHNSGQLEDDEYDDDDYDDGPLQHTGAGLLQGAAAGARSSPISVNDDQEYVAASHAANNARTKQHPQQQAQGPPSAPLPAPQQAASNTTFRNAHHRPLGEPGAGDLQGLHLSGPGGAAVNNGTVVFQFPSGGGSNQGSYQFASQSVSASRDARMLEAQAAHVPQAQGALEQLLGNLQAAGRAELLQLQQHQQLEDEAQVVLQGSDGTQLLVPASMLQALGVPGLPQPRGASSGPSSGDRVSSTSDGKRLSQQSKSVLHGQEGPGGLALSQGAASLALQLGLRLPQEQPGTGPGSGSGYHPPLRSSGSASMGGAGGPRSIPQPSVRVGPGSGGNNSHRGPMSSDAGLDREAFAAVDAARQLAGMQQHQQQQQQQARARAGAGGPASGPDNGPASGRTMQQQQQAAARHTAEQAASLEAAIRELDLHALQGLVAPGLPLVQSAGGSLLQQLQRAQQQQQSLVAQVAAPHSHSHSQSGLDRVPGAASADGSGRRLVGMPPAPAHSLAAAQQQLPSGAGLHMQQPGVGMMSRCQGQGGSVVLPSNTPVILNIADGTITLPAGMLLGNHQTLHAAQQLAASHLRYDYDGVDVMERLSLKLHNARPEQLAPDIAHRLHNWLKSMDAVTLQGTIRSGCVHLVVDISHRCNVDRLRDKLPTDPTRLAAALADIVGLPMTSKGPDGNKELPRMQIQFAGRAVSVHGSDIKCSNTADQDTLPLLEGVGALAIVRGEPSSLYLTGLRLAQPGAVLHVRHNGARLGVFTHPDSEAGADVANLLDLVDQPIAPWVGRAQPCASGLASGPSSGGASACTLDTNGTWNSGASGGSSTGSSATGDSAPAGRVGAALAYAAAAAAAEQRASHDAINQRHNQPSVIAYLDAAERPGLVVLEWEQCNGAILSDWWPVVVAPDAEVAQEVNVLMPEQEEAWVRPFLADLGLVLEYLYSSLPASVRPAGSNSATEAGSCAAAAAPTSAARGGKLPDDAFMAAAAELGLLTPPATWAERARSGASSGAGHSWGSVASSSAAASSPRVAESRRVLSRGLSQAGVAAGAPGPAHRVSQAGNSDAAAEARAGQAARDRATAMVLISRALRLLPFCCSRGMAHTVELLLQALTQRGHVPFVNLAQLRDSKARMGLMELAILSGSAQTVATLLCWGTARGYQWEPLAPGVDGATMLQLAACLPDGGAVLKVLLQHVLEAWAAVSRSPTLNVPLAALGYACFVPGCLMPDLEAAAGARRDEASRRARRGGQGEADGQLTMAVPALQEGAVAWGAAVAPAAPIGSAGAMQPNAAAPRSDARPMLVPWSRANMRGCPASTDDGTQSSSCCGSDSRDSSPYVSSQDSHDSAGRRTAQMLHDLLEEIHAVQIGAAALCPKMRLSVEELDRACSPAVRQLAPAVVSVPTTSVGGNTFSSSSPAPTPACAVAAAVVAPEALAAVCAARGSTEGQTSVSGEVAPRGAVACQQHIPPQAGPEMVSTAGACTCVARSSSSTLLALASVAMALLAAIAAFTFST